MLAKRLHENKLKRALATIVRKPIQRISPVLYTKLQYRYITHHKLDLKNPIRYTEKLQYLRLFVYPKLPEVSRLASRDGVRLYLHEKGMDDLLIPSFGVYRSFDDIPLDSLPRSFVLKCTHASGWNEIVLNKECWDIEASRKKFTHWLKKDYGKKTTERHYSHITPQIIVEQYIGEGAALPTEYKIHVYNGKARYLYVVTGRGKDIRYNHYYIDWTPFPGAQFNGWLETEKPLKKPNNLAEMALIAEKLAAPFPFVRVDLYDIDGKIYFSEMTFTPAKGTLIFDDDEADFIQGKWLDISKEMALNAKKR